MKFEENSTFPSSLMNYLTSAIVLIQQISFCIRFLSSDLL